jgi:hypothetical protein
LIRYISNSPVLRFCLAFTVLSLLFTLLSWGQSAPNPFWDRHEESTTGLAAHLIRHALVGAIVALPTRRWEFIVAGALTSLLIDVDHLGWLGVPTVSRSSHSLCFLVLVVVSTAILARKGLLGYDVPPVLSSAVAGAVVCAHVALDILDTQWVFPVWAPASFQMVRLTDTWAVVLLGLAIVAVGASAVMDTRRRSPREYNKAMRSDRQHL